MEAQSIVLMQGNVGAQSSVFIQGNVGAQSNGDVGAQSCTILIKGDVEA